MVKTVETEIPTHLEEKKEKVITNHSAISCNITSITVTNISSCNDNGTTENFQDDFITATVTVQYSDIPTTGTLNLTGDGIASISVNSIGSTSHSFSLVVMSAGAIQRNITLTASFSAVPACKLTINNGGQIPAQCSGNLCPCAGGICNFGYPACWPAEPQTGVCGNSNNYAPDANFPEHIPIRYVNVVLHIFQKEDPDNLHQWKIHPTDPGNFTEAEHMGLLMSWFDSPYGVNGFMANLCDDPLDNSPYITDSRIRFLNTGTVGKDVFFHPDNQAWGIGYNGCSQHHQGISSFWSDVDDKYVTNPPINHPYYLALISPETRNSFHIFIHGSKWVPLPPGNPEIPDANDCIYPCAGGATNHMDCINGQIPPNPIQGIFGTYNVWLSQGQTGPCANDYPLDENGNPLPPAQGDPLLGKSITGEFLHVLGVDHISPLQAHKTHANGDDGCDDTPWDSNLNMMGCKNKLTRCALTQCQLGKMHYLFTMFDPPFQRYPDGNGKFVMTRPCGITEPDIVINNGEVAHWKGNRHLRSNVVVQTGGTLTINCDISMPKDAKITVRPGGKLFIDGATISSNCDDRWEGIEVHGVSTLPQLPSSNQGFLKLINNPVIQDANTAIKAYNPATFTNGGGIVFAEGVTFINNRRALDIQQYQYIYPFNGQMAANISYFKQCVFDVDDDLKGNQSDFKEHVNLYKVTGIDFHGCSFTNNLTFVQNADLKGSGIYSVDAEFSVGGLCQGNPTPPCPNWKPSVFEGFNFAINAANYGAATPFRITRTNFSDNVVGILAKRVDRIYAVNNTFEVGSSLPLLEDQFSDEANRGIHLSQCTGYKIEENTFTEFSGTGTINPVGILISSSGQASNEIYKNSLSNLHWADLSNGVNRSTNPVIGLKYLCNSNASNQFDFAVPNQQGGLIGIAGNQGSAQVAACNSFTTSTALESNFLNQASVINYFFFGTQCPEPFNTSGNGQVLTTQATAVNQCPSKIPASQDGFISEMEIQQMENEFNTTTDESVRTYAGNMIIRQTLADSAGINLEAARTWLRNLHDLESGFVIVDTWLQESQPDSAQAALTAIPNQFTLSDEQQTEYYYFNSLKTLQINAMQSETSERQMVAANQAALTEIAEAGDYYASAQAQNLLNRFNGMTYNPIVVLPQTSGMELKAPPVSPSVKYNPALPLLQAIPNPAAGKTEFIYRLPEGLEQARLIITTATGLAVSELAIEGNTGKIAWETKGLPNGVYLYSLVAGKETLKTERLMILK